MRNIYPFGKAPFVILIIAIVSGLVYGGMKLRRSSAKRPELILVFQADIHQKLYEKAAKEFGEKHNCTVKLQRVQKEVLMDRLQSAMQTGCEVPDLVELLEGTIGYFTRGKLENVGLVDLTDRLKAEGYMDPNRMVQKRYALWSSRGHIFAIPHDVHPAGLCYRVDLLEKLGKQYDFDVTDLTTWDKFVEIGQKITGKWEETDEKLGIEKGKNRYMIDMADDSMISMIILLTQRGYDLFDKNGNVAFDKPEVAELIAWFVHQTSGPKRIAFPAGDGQNFYQGMTEGLDLFYFTPDWRTMQFTKDLNFEGENKEKESILKGKLGLIPMPVWTDQDGNRIGYGTGTWGGSGLAITKSSNNQDLAWEFAKFLYLEASQEDFAYRFKETNIVPPVKEAWNAPGFRDDSPYFKQMVHDEKTGELVIKPLSLGSFYADQADSTPPHFSTAYTTQAETEFLNVYYDARDFYKSRIAAAGENPSEETLKQIDEEMLKLINDGLKKKAAYIKRLIDRNVFLKEDIAKGTAAAATPAETTTAKESAEKPNETVGESAAVVEGSAVIVEKSEAEPEAGNSADAQPAGAQTEAELKGNQEQ